MLAPLLLLGLLGLGVAAAASTAKAQPVQKTPALPATTKRKTTVVTRKTPRNRLARARLARALRSRSERRRIAKIAKARVVPASPKAQQALKNLIALAISKKATSPEVRRKAARQVKAITVLPPKAQAVAVKSLPAAAKRAIAKQIVHAESNTKPTGDQAAKTLQIYTKSGGNQGTRRNPSSVVKNCQRLMGFSGKDADGIIGPKTRRRAKALGYPLYPRSYQKKK